MLQPTVVTIVLSLIKLRTMQQNQYNFNAAAVHSCLDFS
jgi:hypothetical protein